MNYLDTCSEAERQRFRIRLSQNAKRIPETGCLEWTGTALTQHGYGVVTIRRDDGWHKVCIVHRLSYELHKGPIPDGHSVLHWCDNTLCFEPEHLSTGTPAENSADMVRKGRQAHGTHAARSKLTEEQVALVRKLHAEGMKVPRIARMLGLSQFTLYHVVTDADHRTWKHLP